MEQGLDLEDLGRWGEELRSKGRGFVLRRPKNTFPFFFFLNTFPFEGKQSEQEKEINRIPTLYLQFLMEVRGRVILRLEGQAKV